MAGHKTASDSASVQNHKAQLANAYNELGKELSSTKIKVVGNYTLGRVIGEGAYGKVRMGTHRLTSTKVAIKQIPKAMSASLTREIHHHRQLHHPHITQMYEVIATESSIWIVTELCSGGELFDYLVEKSRLSEQETRRIFGQTCLATAYLHEKGIVHRDLKLENVLLDERCRVKLGDFGFTREFERGGFLETFCGTTGYASPEMLQGKKYTGPEVDVWSLGVIFYCLLTGTLPFDDDSEDIMRDKIIQGDFEDPEWLSPEARDLIQKILQKDTSKRITIPQILAHAWFTSPDPEYDEVAYPETPVTADMKITHEREPMTPTNTEDDFLHPISEASTSTTPDSNGASSAPTTPDSSPIKPFKLKTNTSESTLTTKEKESGTLAVQQNRPRPLSLVSLSSISSRPQPPPPQSVRTPARTKRRSVSSGLSREDLGLDWDTAEPNSPTARMNMSLDSTATATPAIPIPEQPSPVELVETPLPLQDFSSLLSTPTPIIFSTPLERSLLNALSALGFDTAQIVHSVLSNACDASGAVWWMMKRGVEKRGGADGLISGDLLTSLPGAVGLSAEDSNSKITEEKLKEEKPKEKPEKKKRQRVSTSVQTDETYVFPASLHLTLASARSAPQLAFVPPTPTIASSSIHSRNKTPPPRASLLSPSDSTNGAKSHPTTPSGSLKERGEKGSSEASRGRKGRSGSVSIMQRAATALEAAGLGLVRKKSSDAVRDGSERDHKEHQREKSKEAFAELKAASSSLGKSSSIASASVSTDVSGVEEETVVRLSHGSHTSSKKSPKTSKEHGKEQEQVPSTPPPLSEEQFSLHHPRPLVGSPWVIAGEQRSYSHPSLPSHVAPPTPANSPGEMHRFGFGHSSNNEGSGKSTGTRNRANLLTAFRLWFGEDRKGKRKDNSGNTPTNSATSPAPESPSRLSKAKSSVGTQKRRTSGGKFATRSASGSSAQRPSRPSASSRRSSSLNSRRSSGASVQMIMLDSPHIVNPHEGRRSFGSHTPNSERGDISSRPSSVHSLSMIPGSAGARHHQQHRKSPSASSAGSTHYARTASPSRQKYHTNNSHRRQGSGSSTKVVKQNSSSFRPIHARSNSAASSIMHSPTSSRPVSFYDASESDAPRTASPYKQSSRRSIDEGSNYSRHGNRGVGSSATFVQKRQGPFMSPVGHGYSYSASLGRSSWKKSWGLEPPGWQTRTAHLPIEVLAISPALDGVGGIRDVFSGRQSLSLGDESDWVDEDDFDAPAFAGGLGQLATSASAGSTTNANATAFGLGLESSVMTLAPAPRGHRTSGAAMTSANSNPSSKRTTAERVSPVPPEMDSSPDVRVSGRRQLPVGRSGPAAIQEEDEGEEE